MTLWYMVHVVLTMAGRLSRERARGRRRAFMFNATGTMSIRTRYHWFEFNRVLISCGFFLWFAGRGNAARATARTIPILSWARTINWSNVVLRWSSWVFHVHHIHQIWAVSENCFEKLINWGFYDEKREMIWLKSSYFKRKMYWKFLGMKIWYSLIL